MRETTPAIRFVFDRLAGYLAGGREHGVELTRGADGKSVTRPMCMNLEHYYAVGRDNGMFVPRYTAPRRTELIDSRSLRVTIEPHDGWRLTSTVMLRVLEACRFEAVYEFTFDEPLQGFDALVSHYFHTMDEPWLHLDGRWVRPMIGDQEHIAFPVSDAAAAHTRRHIDDPATHTDVKRYVKNAGAFSLPVSSQHVTAPVMISPVGAEGWSLIHVVEPTTLVSFSANRCYFAHDFTLIGRDVARGERVTCRAWMIYTQLNSPDDALAITRQHVAW